MKCSPSWVAAPARNYVAGFVGFLVRNAAPDVKREVATPVCPAYSMSMNPTSAIVRRRSRTGIAPPIQSDQASRLLAISAGKPSLRTMSAKCKRPPGLRTRKISRRLCSLSGERLSMPFEVTTSKVSSS